MMNDVFQAGKQVDVEPLVGALSGEGHTVHPIPEMIHAIKCIRAEGIKTALLTNNFYISDQMSFNPMDKSLFDVVCQCKPLNICT